MTNQGKNLVSSLLFGGLLVAVTFKFYNKDINLDLRQVDKIKGAVTTSSIVDKSSVVGGKISVKGSVFNFHIENSDQNFAAHRPSQNYSDLLEQIRQGDTITVFYRERQDDDLNLDIFQIEKNGKVILDYRNRNTTFKKLSWITGFAGLALLTFGFWQYFKRTE